MAAPLTILFVSWPARAEQPVAAFSGPADECPPQQYLAGRIETLLGHDVPKNQAAYVTIARSEQGRYEARVLIQTPLGAAERHLSGESCRVALDAVAIIVAISIVPERASEIRALAGRTEAEQGLVLTAPAQSSVGGSGASASASTKSPPESSIGSRPEADAPASTGSSTDPLVAETPVTEGPDSAESSAEPPSAAVSAPRARVSVAVYAAVAGLAMPSLALGAGAGAMVRMGTRLAIELSGNAFLNQDMRRDAVHGAGFTMLSGNAHACYLVSKERLVFGPCLGVVGLRLVGHGKGTENTYAAVALSWGPTLGWTGQMAVTRQISIRAYADVYAPVARPRFLLEGNEVHRVPLVGASVWLGPEMSF